MPDTRAHRGPHPDDGKLFASAQLPALRRAQADLCWLLDHGYAMTSSLELVGNRHGLTQRQRLALARSACSEEQRQRRTAHEVIVPELAGRELWIDGYNLLILVEAALGGGVLLQGRDGCVRDLASLHGTYRAVDETLPALTIVGDSLRGWKAAPCTWVLDQPVSNSGRLRGVMLELAAAHGWPWDVQLEFSPDKVLSDSPAIVATSDSMVLDRCERWVNAARAIITTGVQTARIIDLSGAPAGDPFTP